MNDSHHVVEFLFTSVLFFLCILRYLLNIGSETEHWTIKLWVCICLFAWDLLNTSLVHIMRIRMICTQNSINLCVGWYDWENFVSQSLSKMIKCDDGNFSEIKWRKIETIPSHRMNISFDVGNVYQCINKQQCIRLKWVNMVFFVVVFACCCFCYRFGVSFLFYFMWFLSFLLQTDTVFLPIEIFHFFPQYRYYLATMCVRALTFLIVELVRQPYNWQCRMFTCAHWPNEKKVDSFFSVLMNTAKIHMHVQAQAWARAQNQPIYKTHIYT